MYLLCNCTFGMILQNPNFVGQTRYINKSLSALKVAALCDLIIRRQKSFPSSAVVFSQPKTIKELLRPGAEGI